MLYTVLFYSKHPFTMETKKDKSTDSHADKSRRISVEWGEGWTGVQNQEGKEIISAALGWNYVCVNSSNGHECLPGSKMQDSSG